MIRNIDHVKVVAQGGFSRALVLSLMASLTLTGCKSLTDNAGLPSGYVNPDSYKTPEGARGAYDGAVIHFEQAFIDAAYFSGLLSDELDATNTATLSIDARNASTLPVTAVGVTDLPYKSLQAARSYAVQAIGALSKYAPNASPSLRGRVYAFKGYAEVLLADLYCAGVPLSELEFEGDFTYKPGSSTKDVYAHALVLFDSAITLAEGNDSVTNLARIGKGRALLALDSTTVAANVVAAVPDNFVQQFMVNWVSNVGAGLVPVPGAINVIAITSVSDRAGINGLLYRSSGDPRTTAYAVPFSENSGSVGNWYSPAKYGALSPLAESPSVFHSASPMTVASGIEARLIQAEAALKAGQVSTWLEIVNTLRTTGTWDGFTDVYTCPVDRDPSTGGCPVDSTFVRTDTLWRAGTGGIAGLHPLSDPGTANARVDTMFAERAAWLFVDGHRQGDMRRLIRQYSRTQQQVYPTGSYQSILSGAGNPPVYGDDVVLPIPQEEMTANPLSHGCFDRKA